MNIECEIDCRRAFRENSEFAFWSKNVNLVLIKIEFEAFEPGGNRAVGVELGRQRGGGKTARTGGNGEEVGGEYFEAAGVRL